MCQMKRMPNNSKLEVLILIFEKRTMVHLFKQKTIINKQFIFPRHFKDLYYIIWSNIPMENFNKLTKIVFLRLTL